MPDGLTRRVLRWFRVPAEPEPPAGDPSSIRVFRAAPNFFRYRLVGWAIGQVGTFIGLLVGLVLGWNLIDDFSGNRLPGILITIVGVFAWLAFLFQVPVTFAALRLDYELRWYMLSDRAIRIREGIVNVREKTMTFANIQQISVKQGPLQRLLGIADIEVRTAGGGASGEAKDSMHRGYFRGVADAESIRDTIRDRVRRYRDAGLGDTDGPVPEPAGEAIRGGGPAEGSRAGLAPGAVAPATLEAARAVLAEARALRLEHTTHHPEEAGQ
ncbi:MAG: PH domain-containing protein [Candidatus Longimicrobiales bacterium M2_2A_002]